MESRYAGHSESAVKQSYQRRYGMVKRPQAGRPKTHTIACAD
jgi:hypothetical protein